MSKDPNATTTSQVLRVSGRWEDLALFVSVVEQHDDQPSLLNLDARFASLALARFGSPRTVHLGPGPGAADPSDRSRYEAQFENGSTRMSSATIKALSAVSPRGLFISLESWAPAPDGVMHPHYPRDPPRGSPGP